ncbi:hypothetical protein GWK47_051374 [Chionoecetes opilio]|uniref:Uncharacterized protein n=1 Tax=Chionoecetes opilio TaxID=41210 RepID=A0A8J4Y0U0_CHIOP|nr:hypothetical protein GWK47_051374 [Chionoecetes opilio]
MREAWALQEEVQVLHKAGGWKGCNSVTVGAAGNRPQSHLLQVQLAPGRWVVNVYHHSGGRHGSPGVCGWPALIASLRSPGLRCYSGGPWPQRPGQDPAGLPWSGALQHHPPRALNTAGGALCQVRGAPLSLVHRLRTFRGLRNGCWGQFSLTTFNTDRTHYLSGRRAASLHLREGARVPPLPHPLLRSPSIGGLRLSTLDDDVKRGVIRPVPRGWGHGVVCAHGGGGEKSGKPRRL